MIAEDAVWRVPGAAPVARRGTAAATRIFELFRETRRLTDGTYLSELRWALADDEHAVAVYRARGRRLGRELDIDQVLLITLRDGQLAGDRRGADRSGRVRGLLGLTGQPKAVSDAVKCHSASLAYDGYCGVRHRF